MKGIKSEWIWVIIVQIQIEGEKVRIRELKSACVFDDGEESDR